MARNITKETFLYRVLNEIERTGCSVQRALSNLIQREVQKTDFSINVRGSSLVVFSNNSLDFALKQFLGVNYGGNENTIVGTAVHAGADYAYSHKMKTNKIPSLEECIKVIHETCEKEIDYINPDKRDKVSLEKIKFLSEKFFRVYYPEIQKNVVIASEESFSIDANYSEDESNSLLLYKKNIGKITLTGTLDRIYKKDNVLILSDLKTSSKRISGYVDVNPLFSKYSNEVKALVEEKIRLEKIINKFSNSIEKLQELSDSIKEQEKLLSAKEQENAPTVRISKKIDSLKDEQEKWKIHVDNFEASISQRDQINLRLDDLEKLLKPLKREYAIAKQQADLEAAKKKYGHQLAFYAISAMSTSKDYANIKRLRVEVIIKEENPYLQIFEWDLTEEIIDEVAELIKTIISNIELVIEGIDPLVCFRLASETYVGTDTINLIDEIKLELKNMKELQLFK